jgi:hypothetical protein
MFYISLFVKPCYSFSREIEKATSNFTTIIGNGAFGSVYKAVMSTGETVAVKVLGANSKQGEQEFLTEVIPHDMLRFLSTCLHLKEDFILLIFHSLFDFSKKDLGQEVKHGIVNRSL